MRNELAIPSETTCHACGATRLLPAPAVFCPRCGSRLRSAGPVARSAELEIAGVSRMVHTLRLQHALDRLDGEWFREREQYAVRSRNGKLSFPKNDALSNAVYVVAIAVLVIIILATFASGAPFIAPLGFSALLTILIGGVVNESKRATRYRIAKERYEAQRRKLLAEIDGGS